MTHFDLGTDALIERQDLARLSDPWAGAEAVRPTRFTESLPALPDLGPWAAALELPGLDCSALGRH